MRHFQRSKISTFPWRRAAGRASLEPGERRGTLVHPGELEPLEQGRLPPQRCARPLRPGRGGGDRASSARWAGGQARVGCCGGVSALYVRAQGEGGGRASERGQWRRTSHRSPASFAASSKSMFCDVRAIGLEKADRIE